MMGFGACVATLAGLVAGAGLVPRMSAPLYMFVGAGTTWLGTTLFYIGFLYGRWEANALKNVIEELELHRRCVREAADGRGDTARTCSIIRPAGAWAVVRDCATVVVRCRIG